jgi:Putative zinc-finger
MSIKQLTLLLTLSCDGASRLISEQMDRDLTLIERMALRLHALGCRSCPRFMRHLWLLRTLLRQREESLVEFIQIEGIKLSDQAQTRIHQALRQASQADSS